MISHLRRKAEEKEDARANAVISHFLKLLNNYCIKMQKLGCFLFNNKYFQFYYLMFLLSFSSLQIFNLSNVLIISVIKLLILDLMIAIDDWCSKVSNVSYSKQIYPLSQGETRKLNRSLLSLQSISNLPHQSGECRDTPPPGLEKAHLPKHVWLLSRRKLVNEGWRTNERTFVKDTSRGWQRAFIASMTTPRLPVYTVYFFCFGRTLIKFPVGKRPQLVSNLPRRICLSYRDQTRLNSPTWLSKRGMK